MSDRVKSFLEYASKFGPVIVAVLLLILTAKMDERYVTKEQYRTDRDQLREDLKELRQDIKTLLRRP